MLVVFTFPPSLSFLLHKFFLAILVDERITVLIRWRVGVKQSYRVGWFYVVADRLECRILGLSLGFGRVRRHYRKVCEKKGRSLNRSKGLHSTL